MSGWTTSPASAVLERSALRVAPERKAKIQICLTSEERALLTRLARERGHDSVASYVRHQTLGAACSG